MIRGLLFDYGGVIADDSGDLPPVARLIQMFGLDETNHAEATKALWRRYLCGELATENFWDQIGKLAGSAVTAAQQRSWRQTINTKPYPELSVALSQLRAASYQIGLLSNITTEGRDDIAAAGTYDLFDFTVLSCNEGIAKPTTEIYERSLVRFNRLASDEIVFVDDYEINLPPAQALSMHIIHATSPVQVVTELKHLLSSGV